MFDKSFEGMKIVVDQSRDDCNREPAHCHVVKSGSRVAQIMVEPSVYAKHSSLTDDQTARVENFVSQYRRKLSQNIKRMPTNGKERIA